MRKKEECAQIKRISTKALHTKADGSIKNKRRPDYFGISLRESTQCICVCVHETFSNGKEKNKRTEIIG